MALVCLGFREKERRSTLCSPSEAFHTLVLKLGQLTFVLAYIQISMCVSKYINHTLKDCALALPSV